MKRLLLLLVTCPSLALAAPVADAWQMMEKAALAARELNYKGFFVYQAGSNMTSVQITHTNMGAAGEFSRTVVMDGTPRETLRQGNDAVIYQSKSQNVLIEKRRIQSSFPAMLPRVTEGLKANYQLLTGGSDRVVGREAQLLTLSPHDQLRYASKFWIDRESGLLLKVAWLNDKEEVVEQIGFTQLQLVEGADIDWFHPNREQAKAYVVKPEDVVTPTVQAYGWTIGTLPPGFRKIEQVKRLVPGRAQPVTHMVFCDGLTSISLFIEPLDKRVTIKQGSLSQGTTNLYATTLADHQIVVLGEVPSATVMQIVNSLSYKPQ